ncbi:hypothetical protein Gasu2_18640 [Galdieria sulphuraria]|uniref:Zinc finger PHD-type domain-containing protein n=1 Tax=Galdieria sulphuraria TaxID=130081 RepID=M2XFL6_GALSU|nr:uncharacterized protein Gasu_36980 [Galdieria sulphuraria]EME28807.1 hypothetical protein Gasu_36980 [Galdieria sulphuraria]GJD07505.1 hypothetical protein Gasu2_18640 [Galdieria sulphuraria]|eukprot:XP_005705327.1 hypothetical protein Gasu_36980 [Galdieria sulphuraria]
MSICDNSLESSQIPKWLLEEWIPSTSHLGNEVDSHPVSHLVPCAICLSLVPWNFSFDHPFVASHCIRLCRNCLESIEKRRMELADKGLLFSTRNAYELSCACCNNESQRSQVFFTCVGCTRSYCKVCVTRILGEYAVATGLVQLQAWFCPLCVRFNVQAKETLKNSRKDQFVLLSLVSFAQAGNWDTPEALPQLTFKSLERTAVEFALNHIAGPDERILERYESNFQQYCRWLNDREQLRWEYRQREEFTPKKKSMESNGVHKKTNEGFIDNALCFWCKEPEATITCSFPRCSKTFHRGCIMSEIVEGSDWICPWHACLSCGAVESNENVLRKCRTCPISYCALHVPTDKVYQGEEIYYYGEHYILCQRCTPFVERPTRRWKSSENNHMIKDKKDMDIIRMDGHKHASNQEMSKEWKRIRIEKTAEETSHFIGMTRREHRNKTSKVTSHPTIPNHSVDEQAAMPSSNKRASRKSDDVNSRIARLVAERSHEEVSVDMDQMKEYIREDIQELGVSGPCRLAALYVLKKAGRPLSTSEIAERMVLEGLWLPTGATPVNTIAGLLSSDSKKAKERNGSYIYFDRLGPSLFVYNRRGRG